MLSSTDWMGKKEASFQVPWPLGLIVMIILLCMYIYSCFTSYISHSFVMKIESILCYVAVKLVVLWNKCPLHFGGFRQQRFISYLHGTFYNYYLGSQLIQGSKLMQEPAFWNVTALGQITQQLFNFLLTFHCISLDHFLVKFCHRQEGIKVGMFVNRPILLKRST